MKGFFSKLGAFLTGVRVWTINIFTLVFIVYLVGVVVYLVNQMPETVDPTGKVLIIDPEALVLDQEIYPDGFEFPFALETEEQLQTRDLIKLIRSAAEDDRLAGVLLDFSGTSFAGISTAMQVAEELSAIKASGTPVIAYSQALSTASYLQAAQADEIFVHPSGAVAITGIGGYRDYTRELTDKLKITIHNYSQGDYKSAVEGLTRNDMSEPDKEQRRALYDPLWQNLKANMANARGVDTSLFQTLADEHSLPLVAEAGYSNLKFAEENGLIDGTKTFYDIRSYMIERFGADTSEGVETETYPHISWQAYLAQQQPLIPSPTTEDAVAVVFVQGGIQEGPEGPGVAGSDDIASQLRRAHEADNTRAVVLRVNSPGGSIVASDIIRSEFAAAKAKGLPVVVSMGDVAASGGVWVSMPADRIFAEPATITGSIGVAVAFPTVENSLDYLGIHLDGLATSEHAGWSPLMPVSEKLDALFARWASGAYDHFVSSVANAREKDPEYIRSIAGGRVWLAPDALERGLIDDFGTLDDAVAFAAKQAGLEKDAYDVSYVTKPVSPAVLFLQQLDLSGQVSVNGNLQSLAEAITDTLRGLQGLNAPKATVMCTDCIFDFQ